MKDNPFYTIGRIQSNITSVKNNSMTPEDAVYFIDKIISEYDKAKEKSFKKTLEECDAYRNKNLK